MPIKAYRQGFPFRVHRSVTVLMMVRIMLVFIGSLVVLLAVRVRSLPTGAPTDACNNNLTPNHNRPNNDVNNADDPPGGFFIYSELFEDNNDGEYAPNTTYKGTSQAY